LVYKTAPIGLAFLSTDCRYVMINEHLTEICGISVADHIGRTVREMVPQVAGQVELIVQAILHTGEPVTGIEVNGQRPDGSNVDRVWITYWHPMKNLGGEVIGINVAAEEITERKQAEAELAASQKRLHDLNKTLAERVAAEAKERDRVWNLSQDLLVVSDLSSGRILNVNPAWVSTLGWSSEYLIGQYIETLVHPDDRERTGAESLNLAAGKKTLHFENRLRCRDGSYRWLSWYVVPDSGLLYAAGRDITDRKQSEEQLHTLRGQLAETSRLNAMDAATASIAHEIKQPLAAMVANAGAALRWLKGPDANLAEVQACLENIVRSGHRTNDVVASVRAMFEKKSGKTGLVDVRQLIGDVIALVQGELESYQILLRLELPETLPKVVAASVQLQQVTLNLITNAIEAMSPVTGRERRLTIASSCEQGKSVTITVEDTGRGIDPLHFDKIFQPFFTTKSHGMGLGLAISRSIIEAHGGRLWAAPRNPSGTAFHLTMPISLPGTPNEPTKTTSTVD
jgi:PAS domain S-box-containing protein